MFVQGQEYRRAAIHDLFGGQRQHGISTPKKARAVFLFTGPRGQEAGYADGWDATGSYYRYTGEGQRGNMRLTGGNRAIAEHRSSGKALHLFEFVREGWYRYVGEFEYVDHKIQAGVPDAGGHPRVAIVFRLRRVAPPTAQGKGSSS